MRPTARKIVTMDPQAKKSKPMPCSMLVQARYACETRKKLTLSVTCFLFRHQMSKQPSVSVVLCLSTMSRERKVKLLSKSWVPISAAQSKVYTFHMIRRITDSSRATVTRLGSQRNKVEMEKRRGMLTYPNLFLTQSYYCNILKAVKIVYAYVKGLII